MKVQHHNGQDTAHTDTDEDGPCVITWVNGEDSATCDGWITCGLLFAPVYDDGCIQDGLPRSDVEWYEVSAGSPAVVFGRVVAIAPFMPEPIDAAYDPRPPTEEQYESAEGGLS
jgi:hypothetical protein